MTTTTKNSTTWDGFPPRGLALYCRRCGGQLSGPDGPRPAETYLGTATGLCYGCQRVGPFPLLSDGLDGAVWWEWPPHCPAWRRDREQFVGYPDCVECGGKGRLMVARSDARGGPYPRNCTSCRERYHAHPVRTLHRARRRRLYEAANRAYGAEVERRGLDRDDPEVRLLAREYLARHRRAVDRWASPKAGDGTTR